MAGGLRWVYRGEGTDLTNTLSRDLEPNSVNFNAEETEAYVLLQVTQVPIHRTLHYLLVGDDYSADKSNPQEWHVALHFRPLLEATPL